MAYFVYSNNYLRLNDMFSHGENRGQSVQLHKKAYCEAKLLHTSLPWKMYGGSWRIIKLEIVLKAHGLQILFKNDSICLTTVCKIPQHK